METTTLINDLDNIVVGTVTKTLTDTNQIVLGNAKQPGFPVTIEGRELQVTVTIYGKTLPPIGERVAVCSLGEWITESDFVKTVAAVAEMIGKLDPLSDETRCRLVKMVLRHQMDAARQARQASK